MNIYRKFGKRCADIVAAFLGLVVFSPLFLLISLVITCTDKGPVFFIQKRMGKDFKPFYIYKFRTMKAAGKNGGPRVTSSNDNRITRIGKILRKTKMDELPQLINVLKGEMSFIGPRPEVPLFVYLAYGCYRKVLTVRPGITDYAAIKFSEEEKLLETYEDKEKAYSIHVLPVKIRLYKKYIADLNIITDISVLIATLFKITPFKIDLLQFIRVEKKKCPPQGKLFFR